MSPLYHDPTHERFLRIRRHWCPYSERYTGADSLMTILNEGWQLFEMVFREEVLLGRSRHTTVYHFGLRRDMEFVRMAVISTPYLERLIRQERLHVIKRREAQLRPIVQEAALA